MSATITTVAVNTSAITSAADTIVAANMGSNWLMISNHADVSVIISQTCECFGQVKWCRIILL